MIHGNSNIKFPVYVIITNYLP